MRYHNATSCVFGHDGVAGINMKVAKNGLIKSSCNLLSEDWIKIIVNVSMKQSGSTAVDT